MELLASTRARAAIIAVAVNAIGLAVFLQLRSERLLTAAIDPLNPDWSAMKRAFGAYDMYATTLLAVAAIAIILGASWIARAIRRAPSSSRVRGVTYVVLALALTAGVVLVFIEVLIFQDYGIHFYEFDVIGILANAALRRDLGIQPAEVARVLGAAIVLIGLEFSLCLLAARAAEWRNGTLARASAAALLVACPLGLALFHVAERDVVANRLDFEAALPLGRALLLRASNGPYIATSASLGHTGYATLGPGEAAPVLRRKPNILFFVPDGLRADMISATLTPNLMQFASRPDVIHSRRHFSTGHVSEAGIFGLTYGVDAQAYHAFVAERVPSYPIEVLKRNGYRTLFLASSRLNPYPSDQLIRMFDEVEYPANDDAALAMLARYVEERRRDGAPYFVLAFFYTPHYPFTSAKPQFQRYPLAGPAARTNYMNDVLQTDDYFRQTLDLVRDDFDHGRTILLATSDHGEEIRDHGVFGHAPTTFWNEKILVPFFLGLPGAKLSNDARHPARSSHVDVWPTIFDYLAASPVTATYSDGHSLLAGADSERNVYVYGRYFPETDRPNVLIGRDRKYWYRVTGVHNEQLCVALTKVTDLDDRPLAGPLPAASDIPAFAGLQAAFWRFIRADSAARPTNCTTLAQPRGADGTIRAADQPASR